MFFFYRNIGSTMKQEFYSLSLLRNNNNNKINNVISIN